MKEIREEFRGWCERERANKRRLQSGGGVETTRLTWAS